MTITKKDIEKALDALDPILKVDFLKMSREEQLTVILSLEGSNSNRLAKLEKWQIDFENSSQRYREERERRENGSDESIMNTTQKILKAIRENEASKFNFGIWMRDRVAPGLVQGAIMAIIIIMGLVASGKLP